MSNILLNLLSSLFNFVEQDDKRNAEYCLVDAQLDFAQGRITQEEYEVYKLTYEREIQSERS